jgi:hypothetical protein
MPGNADILLDLLRPQHPRRRFARCGPGQGPGRVGEGPRIPGNLVCQLNEAANCGVNTSRRRHGSSGSDQAGVVLAMIATRAGPALSPLNSPLACRPASHRLGRLCRPPRWWPALHNQAVAGDEHPYGRGRSSSPRSNASAGVPGASRARLPPTAATASPPSKSTCMTWACRGWPSRARLPPRPRARPLPRGPVSAGCPGWTHCRTCGPGRSAGRTAGCCRLARGTCSTAR